MHWQWVTLHETEALDCKYQSAQIAVAKIKVSSQVSIYNDWQGALRKREEERCARRLSLTQTDFPVPLSPIIKTPPMPGSITFNNKASFISSCPATFTKGKEGILAAFKGGASKAVAMHICDSARAP